MPFLPSASCRNLDLPPVNLRFLQSHLTKNAFAIAPTHLCGIALRECDQRNRAKGSRGGLRPFSSAPCRVKGQRPLWGLGQRPNCWSGDQYQESCQQRRRQQSVPASNFARPQTRPPSRSTQQLCCVAPNGRDHTACLPPAHTILRKTCTNPPNMIEYPLTRGTEQWQAPILLAM